MHLVGPIIMKFVTMHSHINVKYIRYLVDENVTLNVCLFELSVTFDLVLHKL